MSVRVSNKDKIIDAATDLFRFFGYNGTSVDMLIKTAGVSKSNFYYYFESKEELGLKVLGMILEQQEKLISEVLLNEDGGNIHPLERILRFYLEAVYAKRHLFLQSGSFFAKMALEQGSINENFRSVVESYFQKTEAAFEICTKQCEELGILHEGIDPEQIPQIMVCHFKGATIMAKVYNSYDPIEKAYEALLDMLIKKECRHLAPKHSQLVSSFSGES